MALTLLDLVWLMMPAYAGNMTAPFARFWPFWNRPINKQLLGAHKTVVGFGFGVAAAVAVASLQSAVVWPEPRWERGSWLLIGVLFGIGALGGDAVKSFFKRRRRLAPGARWIPADQLDFVLGALLAVAPLVRVTPSEIVMILGFSFVADIAVNQVAFRLRVRESAW